MILNGEHISFTCTKLGSVLQVQQSKDPEGLRVFYYLVQVGLVCYGHAWGAAQGVLAWQGSTMCPVPSSDGSVSHITIDV